MRGGLPSHFSNTSSCTLRLFRNRGPRELAPTLHDAYRVQMLLTGLNS